MREKQPFILAVDDDESILALLERILTMEGYNVVTASDGKTAIEILDERQPALTILDVVMPFVNGFDVLARLREKSGQPVIMLSARGEAASREQARAAGANDYIVKPFNVREILERVEHNLDGDRGIGNQTAPAAADSLRRN
jgi:DNA-binding response OmpR family regulator